MTKQKTPHTQTQQDVKPEQTDLEPGQEEFEVDPNDHLYDRMEGAETGDNRTPRKVQTRNLRHKTEPETAAFEGSIDTRTPKRPAQGITPVPAEEEKRQRKVVNERPDAQAGVNHSGKSRK